jgi:hypothetical protein
LWKTHCDQVDCDFSFLRKSVGEKTGNVAFL